MNRVCVIGLGLIGGSIAKRLVAQGVDVIGFDRDASAVRSARKFGIDARVFDASEVSADVCVVALPVLSIPSVLASLSSSNCGLILDVASTKRSVLLAASEAGIGDRFVGCHPFAGSHENGFDAADASMFEGARVFLCATSLTSASALDRAFAFWQSLGGDPVVIDAEEHDREMALASHLPQVLATVLGNVLHSHGLEAGRLGPGGLAMTRLAESSADVWTDILLTNADQLRQPIASLVAGLSEMLFALERGDAARVHGAFATARAWKRATSSPTCTEPFSRSVSP